MSRILGGFSKDVRECPSAEIVRKVFLQVTGVVLVIIMDVGEEVVQPLAHIDLRQFAALRQKKYQIKLKKTEKMTNFESPLE